MLASDHRFACDVPAKRARAEEPRANPPTRASSPRSWQSLSLVSLCCTQTSSSSGERDIHVPVCHPAGAGLRHSDPSLPLSTSTTPRRYAMEAQRDRPPDYNVHGLVEHFPNSLKLPAVPLHAIEFPRAQSEIRLPHLKTVLSPQFDQSPPARGTFITPTSPTPGIRGSSTRSSGHKQSNASRQSTDSASVAVSENGSVGEGRDRHGRARSVVSVDVDDPKVREAAEALHELGNKRILPRAHRVAIPS